MHPGCATVLRLCSELVEVFGVGPKCVEVALRLPFQISQNIATATKRDTWSSPNNAPAAKSDTWISANCAAATKVTPELTKNAPATEKWRHQTWLNCYFTELLFHWSTSGRFKSYRSRGSRIILFWWLLSYSAIVHVSFLLLCAVLCCFCIFICILCFFVVTLCPCNILMTFARMRH